MLRRALPALCLVAGLGLVIASLAGGHGDAQPPTGGTVRAAPPAGGTALAAPDAPEGAAAPPPPAAGPEPTGDRPVELALPTLRVRAPVDRVVSTAGVLGVPRDPRRVGWWGGSATPGAATGSSVLDGHVDSASLGKGALFDLGQLAMGAPVLVSGAAGGTVRYRVYDRRVYDKAGALPAELFATTGPARLVLITCGGPFDRAHHSYRDNVVVLAEPAS